MLLRENPDCYAFKGAVSEVCRKEFVGVGNQFSSEDQSTGNWTWKFR
jgi:hypothetical protein